MKNRVMGLAGAALLVLSLSTANAQVGTHGPLGDIIEAAGSDATICSTCCVDDEDNAQGPYCPLTGLQIPHAPVPGVQTLCSGGTPMPPHDKTGAQPPAPTAPTAPTAPAAPAGGTKTNDDDDDDDDDKGGGRADDDDDDDVAKGPAAPGAGAGGLTGGTGVRNGGVGAPPVDPLSAAQAVQLLESMANAGTSGAGLGE